MLPLVFMPIMFLSEELKNLLIEQKVEVLYEEVSKALPRSINGFPLFASMLTLTGDEWRLVLSLYENAKAAVDAVLGNGAKKE